MMGNPRHIFKQFRTWYIQTSNQGANDPLNSQREDSGPPPQPSTLGALCRIDSTCELGDRARIHHLVVYNTCEQRCSILVKDPEKIKSHKQRESQRKRSGKNNLDVQKIVEKVDSLCFSFYKFLHFPNILRCSAAVFRMKFSNLEIVLGNKLAEAGIKKIKWDLC